MLAQKARPRPRAAHAVPLRPAADDEWASSHHVRCQLRLLLEARRNGALTPDLAARVLQSALARGTRDNLSCLVIKLK